MAFVKAKRRSGRAMSGATGRSNTGRVANAGMHGGGSKRLRGSNAMEIAQPAITLIDTVVVAGFTVTTEWTPDGLYAINPATYYMVVTTNIGVPSPEQLKAGLDATGAAGAFVETGAVIDPKLTTAILLVTDTLYYVYVIAQVDAGAPDEGQWSKIAQSSQRTA